MLSVFLSCGKTYEAIFDILNVQQQQNVDLPGHKQESRIKHKMNMRR